MKARTKAAALAYEEKESSAPKVVAKGEGELARKIIEKAQAFDIPLFQNEMLINALIHTEIDATIEPKLYESVVEVYVWLQKLSTK